MRGLRTSIAFLAMLLAVAGSGMGHNAIAQDSTPKPATGTIEIHGRLCEETPADGDWYNACHDSPLADQVFTAIDTQTQETFEGTTDAAGNVVLNVPPGEYQLSGIPGDFLDDSFIFCSATDAGVETAYPVLIDAEQPSVICDFYAVPTDNSTIPVAVTVDLCVAEGCNENPDAVEPADGVEITVTSQETGETIDSCTSGEDDTGQCTVEMTDLPETVDVTVNEDTLPDGWVADPNPQSYEVSAANPSIWVLLSAAESDATPPPTGGDNPVPLPVPLALELPSALLAGTCSDPEAAQPVDDLNNLTIVDGNAIGGEESLQAASGYTPLAMTIEDLTVTDHVIVVFDEDDPDTIIACGEIGGVLDEDGALSVGLSPVDESGAAGVAHLAPTDDGGSALSIFLVPDDLVPTPESTPIG